ncbi:MAG TPA: FemAB family PEP-CTERM system-associated protein [Cellvibrio sp.]|nr:FemAB family PEP-CTERM system-associated protein [Cellvibrio sp.]
MTHSSGHNDLLIGEVQNYKSQLKQAKKNKAEIAVQFKNAEPGSDLHTDLIAKMQVTSAEIKAIESCLKNAEKKLLDDNTKPIELKLPPLLTIDPAHNWQGDFSIHEITSNQLESWYAFVSTMPNATAYHQKAWADVILQSFDNPTRVWAAFDSHNNIIGGIALTFFSSALFGKFAVSVPYVNYGGVLTAYFNIAQALLAHLPNICTDESLSHIEVRTMQENLARDSSSKKASMILSLPKSSEELDKNLGSKIRAQYKKCEEHGPEIRFGKIELLNDFYAVFARNMRDLGTPVYGKNWFANIINSTAIDSTLAVVYIHEKPVSAGFLVGYKGMLEIPWASTVKEANAFNTNMWMYRKILDFAIEKNFDFFDFGRSTQDAGTYKFKKQWGTVPFVHHWYKVLPNGNSDAPELNPDNPKFALMIAAWKMMPVWLSRIVGPRIIRNIP